MAAATVEIHQHVVISADVYTGNLILVADIGNALRTIFVERVEGQFMDLQGFSAVFHLLDALTDTCLNIFIGVRGTALGRRLNKKPLMQGIPL